MAGQLSQADKERLGLEGGNLERGGLVDVWQQGYSMASRVAGGALWRRAAVRRGAGAWGMAPATKGLGEEAGWVERSLWERAELMGVVLVEGLGSREEQAGLTLACRQHQAGTVHDRLAL